MDIDLDEKISGRLCDLVEEYRSALDRAEEEIEQLRQSLAEKVSNEHLCSNCSDEKENHDIIEELEEALLTVDAELQESQFKTIILTEENLSLHRRLSILEKNEIDSKAMIVKLQQQIKVQQIENNTLSDANKRNMELLDEYEEVIKQQELVTSESRETVNTRQRKHDKNNNHKRESRNNNYNDEYMEKDNERIKNTNQYNNNNNCESSSDQSESESESTLTRAAAAITISTAVDHLSSPKNKAKYSNRSHKLSPLRSSGKLPKRLALLQKLKGRNSIRPVNYETNIGL